MTVIIFGATGMVGTGVVLEWLDDPRIDRVLSVSRHPVAIHNPKLRTIVHRDFFDFATIHPQFSGGDASATLVRLDGRNRARREPRRLLAWSERTAFEVEEGDSAKHYRRTQLRSRPKHEINCGRPV